MSRYLVAVTCHKCDLSSFHNGTISAQCWIGVHHCSDAHLHGKKDKDESR